jgi:hypothetical protein
MAAPGALDCSAGPSFRPARETIKPNAGGCDSETISRETVMGGVERDEKIFRLILDTIAASKRSLDGWTLTAFEPSSNVQGMDVVKNPDLGVLAWSSPFVRFLLNEILDRNSLTRYVVVEQTIDVNGPIRYANGFGDFGLTNKPYRNYRNNP